MSQQDKCLLCRSDATVTQEDIGRIYIVDCVTCGHYCISNLLGDYESMTERQRAALSAATRHASDHGKPLKLSTDNWRDLAEPYLHDSVRMKARKLLELVRDRSRFFGEQVRISVDNDWPLISAVSRAELKSLVNYLTSQELVRPLLPGSVSVLIMTMEGWETVEPIAGGILGQCFVAMSFAPELNFVFDEGIRPAVAIDCGMQAIRLDRAHFKEPVSDRVLADIRRCQFIVSDFTGHCPNVYFEAGFAMGLGRDIIWTCREDEADGLGFDIRQYPCIRWKDAPDLREQLRDKIRAVIPGAKLQ